MTRPDDIIDLIDAGLQSSAEAGMPVGEPDACVRCGLSPLVGAELCSGCRAFLLGDSDVDPVAGSRPACGDPACTQCPRRRIEQALMEDADTWRSLQEQLERGSVRIAEVARLAYEPVTAPWLNVSQGDLVTFNGQAYMVMDIRPSPTGVTWMVRPVEPPAPPMAGLCMLCGEPEHEGAPCPDRPWAEPLGFVAAGPPTAEEMVEQVRRIERETLARRRRGQRRTNRLGPRPGR